MILNFRINLFLAFLMIAIPEFGVKKAILNGKNFDFGIKEMKLFQLPVIQK